MFIVKTDNTWRRRALVLGVGVVAGVATYATIGTWWLMLIAQVVACEAVEVLLDLRRTQNVKG